LLNPPPAL